MGLRVHFREAFKKLIRLKKMLNFRSCIDEGFPNHHQGKLFMHLRITSFFSRKQCSRSAR